MRIDSPGSAQPGFARRAFFAARFRWYAASRLSTSAFGTVSTLRAKSRKALNSGLVSEAAGFGLGVLITEVYPKVSDWVIWNSVHLACQRQVALS